MVNTKQNWKKGLIFIIGLLLISSVNASYSFVTNDLDHYILVDGEGSAGSPIDFSDITDYFIANPIDLNLTMPLSGDLNENNSFAWNDSYGDITTPFDEDTIVQVGNYSIGATKNGSGYATLQWNVEYDIGYGNYIHSSPAEKVVFWIRTNNSAIELYQVVSRKYYSTTSREAYPVTFKNDSGNWKFEANTWTRIEIDIRNDFTTRQQREWWNQLSRYYFYFSGGNSGDKIYIDGLRASLGDPNPTQDYTNVYVFPTELKIQKSYFEDEGFVFISNILNGYAIDAWNNSQFDLGSFGKGGMIYNNNFHSVSMDYAIALQPDHNTANMIGLTMYGTIESDLDYSDSEVLIENCNFYRGLYIGSSYSAGTLIYRNLMFGSLEKIFMGGTIIPIFDGVTYRATDGIYLMWMATGELRGIKPIVSSGRMMYVRGIRDVHEEFNLTNPDFSETGIDAYARFQSYSLGGGSYQDVGYNNTWNIKFTLNLRVVDEDGNPIENATVRLTNNQSTIVLDTITNINGSIDEQGIITRTLKIIANGSIQNVDWDPKGLSTVYTNHGTSLNPLTLTVQKNGYQPYYSIFSLTKEEDWEIVLGTNIFKGIVLRNDATGVLYPE